MFVTSVVSARQRRLMDDQRERNLLLVNHPHHRPKEGGWVPSWGPNTPATPNGSAAWDSIRAFPYSHRRA